MPEWQTFSIRDLIGSPISGSRPTGGVSADSEGIPSLGGENVLNDGGMTYESVKRIPRSFFVSMPKGHLVANDVLINKDGAQTGKVGIYDGRYSEAAINEHLFILRSSNGLISQRLLYYFLLLPETQVAIERRITGSAQPGLNSQFVDAVKLKIPIQDRNQQRIAEILSTVDEAIEQTEALIAKTQKIKAGLMHDLFTRGVTPDGQLRPPREEAPQLYKESPLGWIPKEWDFIPLGQTAEIVSGVTLGGDRKGEMVAPYLRVANVQDGYLDLSEVKTIPINRAEFQKLVLKPGDVLLNEGGDFDKLGRGTVWKGEIENCVHQNHVFRVRTNNSLLRPNFLAAWSQSEYGKSYFLRSSKQSTNLASINSTQLNAFPVGLSDVDEQIRIEEVVLSVSNRVECLKLEIEKLSRLKGGLMADLLSGRVTISMTGGCSLEASG